MIDIDTIIEGLEHAFRYGWRGQKLTTTERAKERSLTCNRQFLTFVQRYSVATLAELVAEVTLKMNVVPTSSACASANTAPFAQTVAHQIAEDTTPDNEVQDFLLSPFASADVFEAGKRFFKTLQEDAYRLELSAWLEQLLRDSFPTGVSASADLLAVVTGKGEGTSVWTPATIEKYDMALSVFTVCQPVFRKTITGGPPPAPPSADKNVAENSTSNGSLRSLGPKTRTNSDPTGVCRSVGTATAKTDTSGVGDFERAQQFSQQIFQKLLPFVEPAASLFSICGITTNPCYSIWATILPVRIHAS